MRFITEQPTKTKNCVSQFLSSAQAKLLVNYITKEVKWNKQGGVKTQTYSKNQKFGSSYKAQEFPLWANMVAKKLYYEKMVDFFPGEVTVIEQDYNSKIELGSILNDLSSIAEKSVVVVLKTFSGLGNPKIQPGSLMAPEFLVKTNKTDARRGKMMAVLFKKN